MPDTLEQLLDLVGKLDDSPGETNARERFRRYLREQVRDMGQFRDYVDESLRLKGDQANRALQDLVNRIGEYLGFSVEYGRYSGVSNQIGYDGLWRSPPTGFFVVAEVKTTEVYAIKTATLLNYVNELVSNHVIPELSQAMGLYIVGWPDPDIGQLENAILAERLTERLRIVSVESLLTLADLMANYDVVHSDVLALIRPSAPTIDPVADLLSRLVGQATQPDPPEVEPIAVAGSIMGSSAAVNADAETAPRYWITSVRSDVTETAEEDIKRLVGENHRYAFGERTPGRKKIKPGDHICFYATGNGVVANATVVSSPERKIDPAVSDPENYPWVFAVDGVALYLDEAVILDPSLRSQLDAFRGKDQAGSWSWFVQTTRRLSKHDFELLTRRDRA